MRLVPRTILGQLIAASILVQLLVLVGFLTFSVRHEFQQTRRRNEQRLENQAKIIAGAIATPLAAGDRAVLDQQLSMLPVSTTLKAVRITDIAGNTIRLTGTTLAPTLNQHELQMLQQLQRAPRYVLMFEGEDRFEGIEPVVANSRVAGVVWAVPDTGVTLRYSVAAWHSVLLYGGIALLANLLAVSLLTGTVARPLRLLRRATHQVRSDPNDLSSFPLPIPSMNEAGALTASFNAMVQELATQRRGTHETLSLLDAMLSSAPIGFAFYDRDCRYVRVNGHLARMHGISMEAHLGKRYRDLLPPGASNELANSTERLVSTVLETGQPVADRELSATDPHSKEVRSYHTSYFPVIADEQVRWVGVIVTEITERKRAEEAMRRSEKLSAAGRLAASIAHEINNPLESVTNLLYLIRQHPGLDSTVGDYATLAQQELSRAAEVTQQTLRFYRKTSYPVDVCLPEMLRSVLALHHGRMLSPLVNVQLKLDDDAVMFGHAGELRQVFANLMGNAIDAMPAGGCIWVRACCIRRDGRRGVKVTIADAGTGMPEAVRRRIFEPFFTTKETTGTGLGLWVTEEILSKHRAVTHVRSRMARYRGDLSGTVFSIFFPADGVPRGPMRVMRPAGV